MQFGEMLKQIAQRRASDLFLKVDGLPTARIDGDVHPIAAEKLSAADAEKIFSAIADESTRKLFAEQGEADFAYQAAGVGRFRVNAYRQQGRLAFVFRPIATEVPGFEQLLLPAAQLAKLASLNRGVVIVTGVAGSGKSTTLAAIIDHINRTYRRHIVTIENPIEFVHADRKSIVSQREVGTDTRDFFSALKHCMRQSPDVILIGEMRDRETMEAALMAAETGHLILSTLHTLNAVQTVERIISYFPPHQHGLIRLQLSMVLQGVISQRLVPRATGKGRVPAVEVMTATPTVREMLMEGRTRDLRQAIHEGSHFGCQTFNQSLKKLCQDKVISYDAAMASADDPDEFKMELSGITRGTQSADLKITVR